MHTKLAEYERHLRNDPRSFVEGVVSFCKQAEGYGDGESTFSKILPWLLAIGGGYALLNLGSSWGRYAEKTGNKLGPVKGPLGKLVEGMLPKDQPKPVWPGEPGYDDIVNAMPDRYGYLAGRYDD